MTQFVWGALAAAVPTMHSWLTAEALDLETLIAIKEEVGAEKDLAVLPLMRRALEESRKARDPDLG